MARIAQKYRPKMAHAKGAKVTHAELMFHGVVLDQHVSYRVSRDLGNGITEIAVGENEELPEGTDPAPIEAYVSVLVERQWDGAPVWVEEAHLVAGHDMSMRTRSLMPGTRESVTPAGARA